MNKFNDIIEKIDKLTVVELAELIKILEEKFGVSATMSVAAATGGGADGDVEEKSVFNVIIKMVGDQKINVIKTVKEVTGLGLKESKDLVDGAPKPIKENLDKKEAEELKKKLEQAGAVVELQ